uniref:Uncharacterized protein n=1 Tax=Glossina pallidipes TaxID=7398 RepID=A0A1A9ZY00_GLOPL
MHCYVCYALLQLINSSLTADDIRMPKQQDMRGYKYYGLHFKDDNTVVARECAPSAKELSMTGTVRFVVYYLIFGLKIEPFLRFICEIRGAYFIALPLHCCTDQPQAIRDEIELLRNDFNNRLKQIRVEVQFFGF